MATHKDVNEYFIVLISMASASMPSAKNADKLRKKEIEFLASCCSYKHQGGNLSQLNKLSKYLIDAGVCKNPREVSHYKTKLAGKKWIRADRYSFELSELLSTTDKPKIFTCELAK